MLSHQLATSFCPLLAVPAVPLPLASPRPLALHQPEQAAPIPSIRALSVKYLLNKLGASCVLVGVCVCLRYAQSAFQTRMHWTISVLPRGMDTYT
jgi:hypothetical protein